VTFVVEDLFAPGSGRDLALRPGSVCAQIEYSTPLRGASTTYGLCRDVRP